MGTEEEEEKRGCFLLCVQVLRGACGALTATARSFLTNSVDCSSVTCSGGKMADHCRREKREWWAAASSGAEQADSPSRSAASGKSPSLR